MSIRFDNESKIFVIETANTEYAMKIEHDRFLTHLFYGKKGSEYMGKARFRSFSPYYEDIGEEFSLTDDYNEFAMFGSGDFRCTALKLRNQHGNCCTCFYYDSYEIITGRETIKGIPCARAQEGTETLIIHMVDDLTGCKLNLFYTVFPKHDIISRYFTLENNGTESVKIEKAMSICLDLPHHNFDMISLYGAHMDERNVQRTPVMIGNQRIMSRRGASSHQFNPFMALVSKNANETEGDVYAFNFVFSGNFLDEVEVDPNGATRVLIGLGEENFGYKLESGESFSSPEAIMTYSADGLGRMSRNMHKFVRDAIVPRDPFKQRPVVLNTWEACYFEIDENVLIDFGNEAIKYGMDMVVMDDGWFGKRLNDRAGLGDWYANPDRFPNGLADFVDRVKKSGIKFGIWIEPEMINPDSDLYRAHPDWCISCEGRERSLSRSQLLLDFANPAVVEYLKQSFKKTFDGVAIDYIKWDFNRHISEPGSPYLPADRQDEALFRFYLGVYDLFNWFKETYPDVMIENCSGGGGRYDLAMMAVSTQIWTSDNTAARHRVHIQYGSLLAYPSYVMSCHVSNPMVLDDYMNLLDYKFKIAIAGMLGYELHILKMQDDVKNEIKKQIEFYRSVEQLIKYGDLYRLVSPFENKKGISTYYYVSTEESGEGYADRILLTHLQNEGARGENIVYNFKISEADANATYRDSLTGKEYTGKQLNEGIEYVVSDKDMYGELWLFERV